MYKLIKAYKNLENHKLLGQVKTFESINFERYIIFNFYPEKSLNNNTNYCSIKQYSLLLNTFLKEQLIKKPSTEIFDELKEKEIYKKFSQRRLHQKLLLNKNIPLILKNFSIKLSMQIWKKNLHNLFIEKFFKMYRKYFINLKEKRISKIFKNSKILFNNTKIKNQIFQKNCFKIAIFSNFFEKWRILKFKLFLLRIYFFLFKTNMAFKTNKFKFKFNIFFQLFKYNSKTFLFKNSFLSPLATKYYSIDNKFWFWFILKHYKNKFKLNLFYKNKFKKLTKFIFCFLKFPLKNIKFQCKKNWNIYFIVNKQNFKILGGV